MQVFFHKDPSPIFSYEVGYRGRCNNLGLMCEEGKEVKKNLSRAKKLYQRSCDLGEGTGCLNLGLMYKCGKGVERDLAKAIEFYREACGLGSRKGYENLQRCLKELEEREKKK